jgi:hypothetical protein
MSQPNSVRCATAAAPTTLGLPNALPGCLGRDTKVNRCLAERRTSLLARYAR